MAQKAGSGKFMKRKAYTKDTLDRLKAELLVQGVVLGSAALPELGLTRASVVNAVGRALSFLLSEVADLLRPFELHTGQG